MSSVKVAFKMLAEVLASEEPVGLRELSRRVRAAPSSALRILRTMEEEQLVVRVGAGYTLGPALPGLLKQQRGLGTLDRMVTPALHRLWLKLGETTSFFVRRGMYRVCLISLEAQHSLRQVLPVGEFLPIHTGASGKVLLAFSDEEYVEELLCQPLERLTAHTLTDRQQLLEAVAESRRNGWAESHGERDAGVCALAAPVWGSGGHLVGAIGVAVPTVRWRPEASAEMLKYVLEAAAQATAALGGSFTILADRGGTAD